MCDADGTGLDAEALVDIADRLTSARREVLETDQELFDRGRAGSAGKTAAGRGICRLAGADSRGLSRGSRGQRTRSHPGYGPPTAGHRRPRGRAGHRRILHGARALMEACCHPYHNELNRASRGSVPRMYFEGNNVDNDAAQGLLDLLPAHGPLSSVSTRIGRSSSSAKAAVRSRPRSPSDLSSPFGTSLRRST